MNLSQHFTLEEMVFSETALRHGMDNTPSEDQTSNLVRLCNTLLEPARDLLSVPFHVNSGFRAPSVNALVGGARNSAHMDGRACDFVPLGLDLEAAFDKIRQSDLVFDQVIFECAAWIHLAVAPDGQQPRKQALKAIRSGAGFSYQHIS